MLKQVISGKTKPSPCCGERLNELQLSIVTGLCLATIPLTALSKIAASP
jgi:hypothetical protein